MVQIPLIRPIGHLLPQKWVRRISVSADRHQIQQYWAHAGRSRGRFRCTVTGLQRFPPVRTGIRAGFTVSGFWTALFASLFVSVFSLFLNSLMPDTEMAVYRLPPTGRTIAM